MVTASASGRASCVEGGGVVDGESVGEHTTLTKASMFKRVTKEEVSKSCVRCDKIKMENNVRAE